MRGKRPTHHCHILKVSSQTAKYVITPPRTAMPYNNVGEHSHLSNGVSWQFCAPPVNLPCPLLSPLQTTIPGALGPRGAHTVGLNPGDLCEGLQGPPLWGVRGCQECQAPTPITRVGGRCCLQASSQAWGLYSSVGSVPAQVPTSTRQGNPVICRADPS